MKSKKLESLLRTYRGKEKFQALNHNFWGISKMTFFVVNKLCVIELLLTL